MSEYFIPYVILLGISSLVLYILMGADKLRAKQGRRRISEKCLFLFAVFGGAVGGFAAMNAFRHKTKHWYFAVGFPVLALLQVIGIFVLGGFFS